MYKNSAYIKGFTLVESLVAITILLLVIMGPMTVAQKGIQSSYYASDQITAVFLAQEAMEDIRRIRDDDALDAFHRTNVGDLDDPINDDVPTWDWYNDLESECGGDSVNGCAFDVESQTFDACSGTCDPLYKTTDGRYVTEDPGEGSVKSIFTRTVRVSPHEIPDGGGPLKKIGALVEVTVTWNANAFGGTEREVKLQTWIYNHYERHGDVL